MRDHLQGPHSPHEDTWQFRGPATFLVTLDCRKPAKLTFAAAAFAKTSLCAAPAVQALAKNLVGPQTALLVAVALSVGVQDGLVQGCLGKVISLKRNKFNYGPVHCALQVNSLIICTMLFIVIICSMSIINIMITSLE